MGICCDQIGNGTVNFVLDFYSWCNIDVPRSGSREEWYSAAWEFSRCLTTGENNRGIGSVVCGLGGVSGGDSSDSGQDESAWELEDFGDESKAHRDVEKPAGFAF